MDDFLKDDTFLARWMANELSEEELKAFKKHPHYNQYLQLQKDSKRLQIAEIDTHSLYRKIKEKQQNSTVQKTISISRRRWMAVAASFLILFSAYFFLVRSDVQLGTSTGEQLALTLEDGSNIVLNAQSSLEYNSRSYSMRRMVKLQGEAFFEIEKGPGFVVKTPNGNVHVLGTSFNVHARDNYLAVSCKTGKVEVSSADGMSAILTPGQQIRIEEGENMEIQAVDTNSISNWQNGESVFVSAPLIEVINALESQFGVNIEISEERKRELFTGSFLHDDLDKALQMVFAPMGYTYEKKNNGTIVIL